VYAYHTVVRLHVSLHFQYRNSFRIGFDNRTTVEPRFPQSPFVILF
jgi:hypothetical protein